MSNTFEANIECARSLDDMDFLFSYRERFHFPQHDGDKVIYLCGNSLGLMPKSTEFLFQKELNEWAKRGVEGHFHARNPWVSYAEQFSNSLAKIVGANESEVIAMNTLTVNLHLLLISFYKPTSQRYKIIMEDGAFPSDQYAIETQVKMHGLDPKDAIIELKPRAGEHCLREEDILKTIEETGSSLACVMMGGVNYYTGQFYPLEKITEKAHEVGALCGFDLAHTVGNLPLKLHDWQVDFACWCTYKYLNSGPGAVGGVFIHEKWGNSPDTFRLAGWWGNNPEDRFEMKKGFVPSVGAASWQMSNAPVMNMVGLKASLDIFDSTSMNALRNKSKLLTSYLYFLLEQIENLEFTIITPKNPEQRGAQLSLLFHQNGKANFNELQRAGVIADWREPNVIRIAPVPLYNSFEDVFKFYEILKNFQLEINQ